jgi:23S rRNA pseudouridine1911/1915/1917 synthase
MKELIELDDDLQKGDGSPDRFERHIFIVDKGQQPLRIDKYIFNRLEGATRNKIQQAIDEKLIMVNGEPVKANYKVRPMDEIIVFSDRDPESLEIKPQDLPLKVVYEDDTLMVIDKAPGMVVHPGCGNYEGTLLNGVAYYLQQQNPEITELSLPRYGLVHRIDKNTSGLLVLGKTQDALNHLAKQFAKHTAHRRYQALVWGDMENDEGTIIAHVGRDLRNRRIFAAFPEGDYGKHAITHYTVLERFGYVTLVECRLETGRTHQIRVHMKYIGHTLFGDTEYGGDQILKGTVYSKYKQFVENCLDICNRQALHAKELGFIHPATGEKMLFNSELPLDMKLAIEKWRAYSKVKSEK